MKNAHESKHEITVVRSLWEMFFDEDAGFIFDEVCRSLRHNFGALHGKLNELEALVESKSIFYFGKSGNTNEGGYFILYRTERGNYYITCLEEFFGWCSETLPEVEEEDRKAAILAAGVQAIDITDTDVWSKYGLASGSI
jgi:hypothetical protein